MNVLFVKENRYPNPQATFLGGDPEWHIQDEYDPLRPNEYEKVVKGMHFIVMLFVLSNMNVPHLNY